MIRELKTLMAVAREGTFAAAGVKVGLTQAAVSAQMRRLETELGFELFDRTGRSARLNALGQQTVARGQELLALYADLGARSPERPAAVRVTVGAIASVQRAVLPEALARFHRQHGPVRTRVVPGLSTDLLGLVDAGELDLAVVIRPPFSLPVDLRWTTLAREPFRLLVPRHLAGRDWAELLATQPFVRYNRASFGGGQVDRFLRTAHLTVHEVCEADELEAIVRLVAHGVGVALAPQTFDHRRWPAAIAAIDLGARTFHREIGLAHRASGSMSAAARELAGLIAAAYGQASPTGRVRAAAATP